MNLDNKVSRRWVLRTIGGVAGAVVAQSLLVPESYAQGNTEQVAKPSQGSGNLLRVHISTSNGQATGINVMRYLNASVEGQLQTGGFFDDVLNFMRLERGDTLDKILVSSRQGQEAQLFTHFRWDDGSKVDLSKYSKDHPDRKVMLADRPTLDGKPQSLDYLFRGDTLVLDLDKMLANKKPGVAETAKKLIGKYQSREINLTSTMMNQWVGSDPKAQEVVRNYVDAAETVYGAEHAAVKELRRLQKDNPAAVLGKMVTPALGEEGGMYHALTQGEGAIKIGSVLQAAEAGKTIKEDKSYAPAVAHRIDLSKPVVYWGVDYSVVDPSSGKQLKNLSYGITQGTKQHHVVNEREADMRAVLGDPSYQAVKIKTFSERQLPPPGSTDPAYHKVWTRDKGLYKGMLERSVTVGPDLATITNSIRPSWIDTPRFEMNYMGFQGVKAQPKGA